MGCCKSRQGPVATAPATRISSSPQIVFLGLDSAGKTTLMYKTLMPGTYSPIILGPENLLFKGGRPHISLALR